MTDQETPRVYLLENDNVLLFVGLKDRNGTAINDAVLTCTLKDGNGVNIPGQSWPTPLVYVDGSSGDYECPLQETLELVKEQGFVAIVDGSGSGLKVHCETPVIAKVRTGLYKGT